MNKIELIKSRDKEYLMLKYIRDNFQDKSYALIAYELNKMGYTNKKGNKISRCNVKDIIKLKLKLKKKNEEIDLKALSKFESNKEKIDNLIKTNLFYSDSKISSVLNVLELFTKTGKKWTTNYLCHYRLNNEDFKKFEYFGRRSNFKKPKNGVNLEKESLMIQTIKENLDKADYEIVEILNDKDIKTLKGLKWTDINLFHYRITREIFRTSEQDSLIKARAGTKKKYYNNI